MNVEKKDAIWSLERKLASGLLAEMVENFKGCTIQSTIKDSAHSNSDEQVGEINASEEQVDARNWLRNDFAEHVDQINYSNKQVDAITYYSYKKVDAISDSEKNGCDRKQSKLSKQ